MTLQEALGSGKKFKRPNHDFYIITKDFKNFPQVLVWDSDKKPTVNFTKDALLATDWETKED